MSTLTAQRGKAEVADRYRYISADSHLEVPPDSHAQWVPKTLQQWVPRKIELPDGGEGFVIHDSQPSIAHASLFAGHSPEEFSVYGTKWSGAGTGSAKQRLAEQDADGIDAEVLYASPQFLRLCRAIPEPESYNAMLRGYNSWLADSYCAEDPQRLFGVGVLPVSTVEAAIAELEHCKKLGLRTANIAAFPAGHRYPSDEDDRFWAAALDLDMPLTVHVSMSARDDTKEPVFRYPKTPVGTQWTAADFAQRCYRYGMRGAVNAVQMILSGVFDRFPKLQIYFAENQIGWIPLFLQQLDRQYERNCHWAIRDLGLPPLRQRPSDYVRQHCHWGFFDDPVGIAMLNLIGVDRVMWSTDFPHAECAWPNSRKLIDETFGDLPDQARRQITAGNAIAYFRLGSP